MIRFLMVLITFLTISTKLIGFTIAGYVVYYIYNYGLDQLLTSLWKGF